MPFGSPSRPRGAFKATASYHTESLCQCSAAQRSLAVSGAISSPEQGMLPNMTSSATLSVAMPRCQPEGPVILHHGLAWRIGRRPIRRDEMERGESIADLAPLAEQGVRHAPTLSASFLQHVIPGNVPHSTGRQQPLCEVLTATATCFPKTNLQLVFEPPVLQPCLRNVRRCGFLSAP